MIKNYADISDYWETVFNAINDGIMLVRPDGLIDKDDVTEYLVHPSPIRSAMFDPGQTSRINVGHFMAELITKDDIWQQWKGQMPVIYNENSK